MSDWQAGRYRHVMEIDPRSQGLAGLPPPAFVHVSERTGTLVRGVTGHVEREVVTRSVLHPGLFISIVARGSAHAGPSRRDASLGYADGEIIVFALAQMTDWVGILHEGSAMRGIGIAAPLSGLASLGLADRFQGLFGPGDRMVSGRAASNARFRAMCESLLQIRSPDACERVLLDAYAMEAIVGGFRLLGGQEKTELRSSLEDRLVRARDLIEDEPTGDWTVDELARRVGLGPRSLRGHFRRRFDQTVTEYARNICLDRARDALTYRGVSVSEAAYDAGYSSPANFATAFRRRFGHVPSECRGPSSSAAPQRVAEVQHHAGTSPCSSASKTVLPERKGMRD